MSLPATRFSVGRHGVVWLGLVLACLILGLVLAPPALAAGGTISTVAGNGSLGYSGDGGAATSAELNDPHGVAVDPDGDRLIADSANGVVRLVAAVSCSSDCPYGLSSMTEGDIYTIAGNGSLGYSGDGGAATSAELNYPGGVAVDADGDLLIADTNNNVVRLVAAISCSSDCPYGLSSMTEGDIYTIAGNGSLGYSGDGGAATSAELAYPFGVAVDPEGDLLIADNGNSRVRLEAAASCSSNCPYGLSAMTKGDMYTIAGDGTDGYSGDGGAATSAALALPQAVAVDADGDVLIADPYDNVVRLVAAVSCSSDCPYGLSSMTEGDIYTIAGTGTEGYSGDGGAATGAEIAYPEGVAVDPDGDLLIADEVNSRVRLVATVSCASNCPYGLSSMTRGDIYTIAGTGTEGYSGDGGAANSAEIGYPEGVAVDADGDLLIADSGNTRVRLVTNGASPALAVSAPSTATAGTAIAALSLDGVLSGGSAATGTVTFTVFGPQAAAPTACASGGTTVGTATASGNGTYHPSAAFTPATVGDYWFYASYGGDTSNNSAASTCGSAMAETVVGAASPALAVGAPSTGTAGTAISAASLDGVLSGGFAATGTVTFRVFGPQASAPTDCASGGTTVGTAAVSGNGTYHPSAAFTPATVGDYWFYASYGGDANNNSAASTCDSAMAETVVGAASPALAVSAPSTATAGTAIAALSLDGVLSGGFAPTGTMTFTVFGPQTPAPTDCASGGTTVGTATASGNGTYHPSAAFTPATVGAYWFYASYAGDTNNNSAASTCGSAMAETVVGAASPALAVSAPSTGTAGTAISAASLDGVLSGGSAATGTVTFRVFGPQTSAPTVCASGGTTVGTASVSGNGTYHPSAAFTPATVGDYWFYASYGGDANNDSAVSTCGSAMTETVVKAPPALAVSAPSTGTAGTAISASSLDGVLSGGFAPTGTVTFTVFGPQASAPTDCASGGTTVGTATASGNGTYHPSAAFTPATVGDYWFYASYGGDANNNSADSTCDSAMAETVVGAASPALAVSAPSTGTAGTAISAASLDGVLSGGFAPTGTVTFRVFGPQASAPTVCASGGTTVGTATVSGNGTYHPSAAFTPATVGDYWFYASYGGDTSNNSADSTCGSAMAETVVGAASPALAVSAPSTGTAGTAISAASLDGVLSGGFAATGTVTFTVFGPQASAPTDCASGGTTVGTAAVSGNGTYHPSAAFTPATVGDYWFYASYGGDTNNNSAASACDSAMAETVVGTVSTATALSSSAGSVVTGQALTLTATVSPVPTGGTVTFTDDGTAISGCGAVSVSTSTGIARCATSYAKPGSHSILASYTGTTADAGSRSGALAETVRWSVSIHGTVSARHATVKLALRCAAESGGCASTLKLTIVEIVRAGKVIAVHSVASGHLRAGEKRRTVTIATHTVTISAGKTITITLTPDHTAQKLLAAFKRLPARLTVALTDLKHTATVTTRTLTIT